MGSFDKMQQEGRERYRSLEAEAGVVFAVLLALSVASWWYLRPGPLFPLVCLAVGVLMFVSNLKPARGRLGLAFAIAVIGILALVAFIPSELGRGGSSLIVGTHTGVSMFGLIAARKRWLARGRAGQS